MRELLKAKGRAKAKAAAAPTAAKAGSGAEAQSAQEQFRALPKVRLRLFYVVGVLMHAEEQPAGVPQDGQQTLSLPSQAMHLCCLQH